MRNAMVSRDHVSPHTPLRLAVAAALAFPDGSMTASGLRRESARGHLLIERIAGEDYTTLANIERMRETCRVEARWEAQQRRQRYRVKVDLLLSAGRQGW
jgi:hypothetical protein